MHLKIRTAALVVPLVFGVAGCSSSNDDAQPESTGEIDTGLGSPEAVDDGALDSGNDDAETGDSSDGSVVTGSDDNETIDSPDSVVDSGSGDVQPGDSPDGDLADGGGVADGVSNDDPSGAVTPDPIDTDDAAPVTDTASDEVAQVVEDESPAPADDTVITFDSYVELLSNVFAVYSGKSWRDEVLAMPGLVDQTFSNPPESVDGELISEPVSLICDNGGTANMVPATEGPLGDNLSTWDFSFADCLDGNQELDGEILREFYEGDYATGNGFVSTDQTRTLAFSGRVAVEFGYFFTASNIELSLVGGNRNFVLDNATVSFAGIESDDDGVSGSFDVSDTWTSNEMLVVSVPEGTEMSRVAGTLQIESGPDNMLLLDGATGDPSTVGVTITANGETTTSIEAWSPDWTDSLTLPRRL